jgi:AhpD family alkylhydroperoxidase
MSTTATPTTFEPPRLDLSQHARGAYRAMIALDGAIELDSSLRDLISLRASILNGCAYCVDMHTLDAAHRGESAQRLHAVAAWHEAPFFSERERAALALVDAITLIAETHVPRETYDTARAYFDEEELCQLLWAITAINAWNRVAIATRMLPGEYQPD